MTPSCRGKGLLPSAPVTYLRPADRPSHRMRDLVIVRSNENSPGAPGTDHQVHTDAPGLPSPGGSVAQGSGEVLAPVSPPQPHPACPVRGLVEDVEAALADELGEKA